MSGGSYDYVYWKIEDITIQNLTPERVAFQKHLKLVAKAMKDIELVDSCDSSPGDESEAIRRCLAKTDVSEALIEQADVIIKQLRYEIFEIRKANAKDNRGATPPVNHLVGRDPLTEKGI